MKREVFTFWTGDNAMSKNRIHSLQKIHDNVGVPVHVIDDTALREKYCPELGIGLHPAYYCLNLAHRADYLRAMFMHFYGGGYLDVKEIATSWEGHFDQLAASPSAYALGYTEISPQGVANTYRSAKELDRNLYVRIKHKLETIELRRRYRSLIGCGAFICKPETPFTNSWWGELNQRLDLLHDDLQKSPCRLHPKERPGQIYDGVTSSYPVPWTYLLGDIFHPLCLKYSSHLLHEMVPPNFRDYE
jgi:hypothetical protein